MDDASIVSLLTGPFSSLLLLAGMGLGAVRFFSGTVVPAVTRWVDQALTQNATMIEEHRADREAWLTQVRECTEQGNRIEKKIGGLYARLDSLQGRSLQ
tara:strand:- start:1370 stop:1666 length:297 start_codon:yes stop_codon:yes gene_type:complete